MMWTPLMVNTSQPPRPTKEWRGGPILWRVDPFGDVPSRVTTPVWWT